MWNAIGEFFLWIISGFFNLVKWFYGLEGVLHFHAVVTLAAFGVSFVHSKFWSMNLKIDISSGPVSPVGCQCPCPVAHAPPPVTYNQPHLGFIARLLIDIWNTYGQKFLHLFIDIWNTYGQKFLQISFYVLLGVYSVTVFILWIKRNSQMVAAFKNALAPDGTVGQLQKSLIEVSLLRLIVWIGDVACDPNQVDILVFLTSLFAYLHFAAVFKLIGIGTDFGWLDGLVSIILTSFEHLVRPWSVMQLVGILLTTIVVCYKNTFWTGHGEKRQQPNAQDEEDIELLRLARSY